MWQGSGRRQGKEPSCILLRDSALSGAEAIHPELFAAGVSSKLPGQLVRRDNSTLPNKSLNSSEQPWNVKMSTFHTQMCDPNGYKKMHVVERRGGWEQQRLTVSSRPVGPLTIFNQTSCKQFNIFIVLQKLIKRNKHFSFILK